MTPLFMSESYERKGLDFSPAEIGEFMAISGFVLLISQVRKDPSYGFRCIQRSLWIPKICHPGCSLSSIPRRGAHSL